MKSPHTRYERRKDKYEKLTQKFSKTINRISNLRLLTFVVELGAVISLFITKNYILLAASVILFLIVFIYLIVVHQRLITSKNYTSTLYEINLKGIKRLSGEWKSFSDTGSDFIDINHPYSQDLDIFGKSSLFQQINMASTFLGRKKLAEDLTCSHPKDAGIILSRQEAIKELAENIKWRNRYAAEAMLSKVLMKDIKPLLDWASGTVELIHKSWLVMTIRIMTVISLVSILLAAFPPHISKLYPISILVLNFIIIKTGNKKRLKALSIADLYKDELRVYYNMIKLFEKKIFTSAYLVKYKEQMNDLSKTAAYKQLDRLAKIMDWASARHNAFFFIINVATLWDYHCLFALEKWREKSGSLIESWLKILGELESLSSLALIKFENPSWTKPGFETTGTALKAIGMGHPLITKNRVCNDICIQKPSDILLVTGSNMSGKSTFLRTSGINLVLAYAGAPVCAESFSCSLMDLYTCMRVGDRLDESISSFYAELLRIKMIVNAVNEGKKIFFLLDEIFKGTNSIDRHTGAKMLIKKLSRADVSGIVSTHDLELGELEKEIEGKVINFHFKEYYEKGEIRFDYRLQPGVSTTRNAIYLMKLAGIEPHP